MNEIEWTLSARINCNDDDSNSPECPATTCTSAEEQVDTATPTERGQSAESDDSEEQPELNILPPKLKTFYSVTAPVCNRTTDATISPDDPHCVLHYTDTILVHMRYKFVKNKQPGVAGSVADRIIHLIKENLLEKSSTCK